MKHIFPFLNTFICSITCLLLLFAGGCSQHASPDVVNLSFSSWGSQSEIEALKPLLKEFQHQNPNIKVKFIHIPKNYFQKLHLLVASNLTPDVIFINNINSKIYIKNNILENLNPFLEADPEISKQDFFDKSLQAFEQNTSLYAIPRDISNIVVYYNKAIFDKYKIPYPQKSWSFDDFLQTAKSLTKDTNNDGKIDIFGVSFEENPLFWLPFLWSNGGGLLSEDLKTVLITQPQSIEALTFYMNLRNKWHVAPFAEEQGSATMAQMFIQGKIAMHISGRWSTPAYRKEENLKWDVVTFPRGKNGSIVDADASGWAISKKSNNKKEAWKLIKFLSSKKASKAFTKSGLIIPAKKDIAYSEAFLNKQLPPQNAKTFLEAIPTAIPTPSNENYQEIIDILNQELEPAFRGQKDLKSVLNKKLKIKLEKVINY